MNTSIGKRGWRGLVSGVALLAAVASGGCGRPFDVKTAPSFIELDDRGPQYDYRALAPEGIVVGVRAVDVGSKGDLAFWTRAVTLHFRNTNGYALLKTSDVQSADGTPGKDLVFGRDENAKPYVYRVRLLVAQGRLFVVEAGGAKEAMDRYDESVSWMLATVRVRCSSWLAPVLASRTCNRW